MPVGSPLASRSILPPCGACVLPVMPAACNAAVLAMAIWPSTRTKIAGCPFVTASISCRVGSVWPGQSVWSQPWPMIHSPCRGFVRPLSNALLHLLQRPRPHQVDVHLLEAAGSQMAVRVVESRHHEVSAQIDDLRLRCPSACGSRRCCRQQRCARHAPPGPAPAPASPGCKCRR